MDARRVLDPTMLLLLYLERNAAMREIYLHLGIETTLALIEHFAGATIRVPTLEEWRRAALDVELYLDESSNVLQKLSAETGLTTQVLHARRTQVRERLQQLDAARYSWAEALITRPPLEEE